MIRRLLERFRRRERWYEHTEGDYLDLRPRLQIGRRRLW
jgi:hypothetical protein